MTLRNYENRIAKAATQFTSHTGGTANAYFALCKMSPKGWVPVKADEPGVWRDSLVGPTEAAKRLLDGTAIRVTVTDDRRAVMIYVDP